MSAMMTSKKAPPATPLIPAATVVVCRDAPEGLQTLLLKRHAAIRFHGGAWVFPGGKVDARDSGRDTVACAKAAACREAYEEAGLHLTDTRLHPLSHWTTPANRERRFATWFFVTHLEKAEVRIDQGEIQDYQWQRPQEALAAHADAHIRLAPATFVTLCWLAQFPSLHMLNRALPVTPAYYLPNTIDTPEGSISLYEGDAGYAAGKLDQEGPRHRLDMRCLPYRYIRQP